MNMPATTATAAATSASSTTAATTPPAMRDAFASHGASVPQPAAGAPTAALLLHGLCSTPDELLPVAAGLRAAGHHVVSVPLPGYSFDATRQLQRSTSYRQWLAAIATQVGEQRAAGRRVVLVGLSAGSALALGTAMQGRAPVDGLVLMSTTLSYDGWGVPPYQFLMPLALYTPVGWFWEYREQPPYGVKNPRVRRWIERELQTRRVSCAGAAVIGVPHLREHDKLRRLVRRRLHGFACPPVLALHARDDEVASPDNVTLLERQLQTPSFRAVLLPDSHHMITIDNDRLQVVNETVRFVDAVAANATAAAAVPPAAVLAAAPSPTPFSTGDNRHALVHI